MSDTAAPPEKISARHSWRLRVVVGVMFLIAVALVAKTNTFLTERFTETTRNRAELRFALYSGNLISEVRRASIVPYLLAQDPALQGALLSGDYSQTTLRLFTYLTEISVSSLTLLDQEGRVVASTNRNNIGQSQFSQPHFLDALPSADTVFTTSRLDNGAYAFNYSRRLTDRGQVIGVIVVELDLQQFEQSWAGISDAVMVSDSDGNVILATEPAWRGLSEEDALSVQPAPTAILRAIRATADWVALPPEAYLRSDAVMRLQVGIPFEGWRMTTFTTYASVRDRVNGILALEIMGFAIFLALTFYLMSRRALIRSLIFQRETNELRALNARLQREVAEREKAEKNLEVAEQTIAQSSKLAVLGEMSASVSHELNQPLAAMKTYLAGANLLLQRKRPDEALASFQRIDDLIERMGAITRQLKSYARKGGTEADEFDLKHAVSSALSMMEPQLKHRDCTIETVLPQDPVLVYANRLRVEQVIINLLRNALDATKSADEPAIEIMLTVGDMANLSVRDNGPGIVDLENLFEPFYTTKEPGEGIGLGLAISSGIVAEIGGRLTAHNLSDGQGAVFEMQLPLISKDTEAAE